MAADPFSGLIALPDGCCVSWRLAPSVWGRPAGERLRSSSSCSVLARLPCEKQTPSVASLWITFFQNTFLSFCASPCFSFSAEQTSAVMSAGSVRRLHSCPASCFHWSSAHFIQRSRILCSPLSALLGFSHFSNSPHSNLSCSSSFYTLQPLICIFLFFASPLSSSILFTVFSLQLLAPFLLYLL